MQTNNDLVALAHEFERQHKAFWGYKKAAFNANTRQVLHPDKLQQIQTNADKLGVTLNVYLVTLFHWMKERKRPAKNFNLGFYAGEKALAIAKKRIATVHKQYPQGPRQSSVPAFHTPAEILHRQIIEAVRQLYATLPATNNCGLQARIRLLNVLPHAFWAVDEFWPLVLPYAGQNLKTAVEATKLYLLQHPLLAEAARSAYYGQQLAN